ncbi:MAG: hypothetical protein ACTTJH_01115 [Bacteroidales bacterium]
MKANIKIIINDFVFLVAIICLVLCNSHYVYGQSDTAYNENVIVNVGFSPIVTDANKINENPTILDTSFSQIYLNFDKIDKGYKTKLVFDTIKAAQVKGEPVAKLYNFNIRGGLGIATSKRLGNGFIPLLQASYSSLRNKYLLYGVDIYSRSIVGQRKDYGKASCSNNDINLWAKKIFDNYAITTRAYYNYNRHYYYGKENFSNYTYAGQPLKNENKDYRIAWHNIGIDITCTKLERKNLFKHSSFFSLNYTTSKTKSRELDLHLLLDGNKTVQLFWETEQVLGLTFDYQHAFRRYDGNWNKYDTTLPITSIVTTLWQRREWENMGAFSQSRALFNLSPYFIFDYRNFHIFTSLEFISKINGYNSFQIFPTITASLNVWQDIVSLYGGFKSEAKLPTLYEITKNNPFVATSVRLMDEGSENLFAKATVKVSPKAQVSLEGGITEMKNYHFFYNLPLGTKPNLNTMNIDYANAKRYYTTLEAHLYMSNTFSLNLHATYQNVKRSDDTTAWYCPKFYTSLKVTYKYEDKLFMTLTPVFKSKQKARYILTEYDLKPMIDINLETRYQYDEKWTFFIDLENMAFQIYQRYYDYPVYSFMGIIGANYRF